MAFRKLKYDFNPFQGLRGDARRRAAQELKEYVRDSVIDKMRDGMSPVSGQRRYKTLSKDYAEREKGGNRLPNLRLDGDLYAGIEVVDGPKGRLRLTVDADQVNKADGHNNFTGRSKLPKRQFIPDERANQKFKRDIEIGIKEIVSRYKRGDTETESS